MITREVRHLSYTAGTNRAHVRVSRTKSFFSTKYGGPTLFEVDNVDNLVSQGDVNGNDRVTYVCAREYVRNDASGNDEKIHRNVCAEQHCQSIY